MRTVAFPLLGLLTCACLGPNPLLGVEDESEGESTGDGDGDGDGEGDGDGDGEGAGEGCNNGVQDGDETDMDCGGSCGPCEPGASCQSEADCSSGVCSASACAEPSCSDGVVNGDELEVDCGGGCRFCEHSDYVAELDDFEGTDALAPGVAMYEDGSFAVFYVGLQTQEFRVRWFADSAAPLGPSVQLTPDIGDSSLGSQSLVAGELAEHRVHAAVNGLDGSSTTRDVFVVERGPETPSQNWPIYKGDDEVTFANMALDEGVSTFVWVQNAKVWLRRRDAGVGDNEFIDLQPLAVDPEAGLYDGLEPSVARGNGVTVAAWVRHPVGEPDQPTIALRRFDDVWLELEPVELDSLGIDLSFPQVAIAEDGRIAVTCFDQDARNVWAAMLDADLQIDGAPWKLHDSLPGGGLVTTVDVAALSDGSFVFAWPDPGDARVHLRRFIGPDTPLVTDVGDEAPWPATNNPSWVQLSTASNLVVVTWSGRVDGVYQIQGQVLSY